MSIPYRFSTEKYERMGELGIFDSQDRVELLDGEIIVMGSIEPPHAGTVMRLNAVFYQRFKQRGLISPQNPAVLDEFSEPQPDIMLLKPKSDFYRNGHPRSEDILLLIEVSDTTLAYDRGRKLSKYAECEVAEVWIVNLRDKAIEQFRAPSATTYAQSSIHRRGEAIRMKAFPEVQFLVEELIG